MGASFRERGRRTGVRRSASVVGAALACSFAPRPAEAQHCQPPTVSDGSLLRPTLRAEAAHFESESMPGYYEGLAVGAGFERRIVRAHAGLPYYRLLEIDGDSNGFGDLDAKFELSVYDA